MCNNSVSSTDEMASHKQTATSTINNDTVKTKGSSKKLKSKQKVETEPETNQVIAGNSGDAMDLAICDNVFFKQIMDLVPANFYARAEASEKLHTKRSRTENSDLDADLPASKPERKRAKFDSSTPTPATELDKKLREAEEEVQKTKKKKLVKSDTSPPTEAMQTKPDIPSTRVSSSERDDLPGGSLTIQQRFQEKLRLLQEKRKALNPTDGTVSSSAQEKKRLKRQMKKLKNKQKNTKAEQIKQAKLLANGGSLDKTGLQKGGPAKSTSSTHQKPVYNKDGQLIFSKFDFKEEKTKKKKKRAIELGSVSIGGGKNYKQLLAKVEKKQQKISNLESTDIDAAKSLKEKDQWKKALQKAEGLKVKDDAELLKKSIKRKEKIKQRNKSKWEGRLDKVDQKIKERQDKRKANIKKKKEGRINKKITKAKKKGRIIPGF